MCGNRWIFLFSVVFLTLLGDNRITRTQSFVLSLPHPETNLNYQKSIILHRVKRQEDVAVEEIPEIDILAEDTIESSGEGKIRKAECTCTMECNPNRPFGSL